MHTAQISFSYRFFIFARKENSVLSFVQEIKIIPINKIIANLFLFMCEACIVANNLKRVVQRLEQFFSPPQLPLVAQKHR